jgi:hypothetical protein
VGSCRSAARYGRSAASQLVGNAVSERVWLVNQLGVNHVVARRGKFPTSIVDHRLLIDVQR